MISSNDHDLDKHITLIVTLIVGSHEECVFNSIDRGCCIRTSAIPGSMNVSMIAVNEMLCNLSAGECISLS